MPSASRKGGRIDFRLVAEAALRSIESLCGEWLPGGHREGHEYKALNPTRADSRIGSFSVNLNTGAWADFATNDKGGDAVSLLAYLQGLSQLEAAREIAKRLGLDTNTAPGPHVDAGGGEVAAPRRRSEWIPVLPAPPGAGDPPVAHIKRGRPEARWEYRNAAGDILGAVYRFRTSDGGKEVLPCCFATHEETGLQEWRWLAFPDPRPLYGLDKLKPVGTVLVVEGEKCADAARAVLPVEISVVTWPGGGKAVGKADWTPLAKRTVIVWPDCDAQQDKEGQTLPEADQPGIKAAEHVAEILSALGCIVRIVAIPAPGAKPGGWDVADAIAEGWTADQVRAFVRDNLRPPKCAEGSETPVQAAPADDWRQQITRNGNGAVMATVGNAYLNLVHRAEWRGVLAFDEFSQRPIKRSPPPFERGVSGEWEGMDDSFASFWLQTHAGMPKLSTPMAAEAAEMAAKIASFDPVRAYLDGLVWDGRERVDHWLVDFFGAPASEYTRLVGRFWLIGMVRRAYEPGCKFDYMPILEGPQGRGKSSALEILAHPWFGNTDFVMGDKDSMAVMQGKWLYEIAELDSFNKADTTRVKSFVSRQFDEFRPAYGRRVVKLPRRVVLVGTTNQFEYFKDASGNRRFWPIKCLDMINLDGLRDARDQLLAEAVVKWKEGARCYPTREEQELHIAPEQESREIADAWEEGVHRYLEEPMVDGSKIDRASSFDILVKGLHLDAGKITKEMTTRVGLVMRKLGWNKHERRGEHPRYVYERPKKSSEQTGAPADGADDVPF